MDGRRRWQQRRQQTQGIGSTKQQQEWALRVEEKRGSEQDEQPKSEEVEETRELGKEDAYERGEGHLPPRLRDIKAEEILPGAGVLIGSPSGT